MILVYVTDDRLGEVADTVKALKEEYGRISYRNPRLFDKPERCDGVFIDGDFPEIEDAYDNIISNQKDSTDYTIAELRELKPDMTDKEWKQFTKGDSRKSIDSI